MSGRDRKQVALVPLAPAPAGPNATSAAPHVRSETLLGGAQELVIQHNEREYRLRVTAQGKLILTA